ncbi:MAG: molecular chaperone SurA [Gammaproteobacteria bacterium]|nr:molecular chaperone SurA [Gammaproteobacteria bacterium]
MKTLTYIAAGVLLASQAWSQTRELGGTGELLDGVAAVVDSGVVLKSELNTRLELVMESLREQQRQMPAEERRPLPPLSVVEEQVLDQLVLRQIQLQRAERFGIVVGDEMLNQAISSVARENGITLEQMPMALASEGIDYAAYRQETREQIIIEQLIQRDVIARITITPRELQQCLARSSASLAEDVDYNLSHILVSLSPTATREQADAARAEIEEIFAQLEDGADFAQLAVTHSDGQGALEGGSLGWRKGAQLPTLFADMVVQMEPGTISDPIQSASGFHIVRVNEIRGAQAVMVDQIRARHILMEPNEILDEATVEQRLSGIREDVLSGDDFGAIAQALSEDPASAAENGDLGWVVPGDFVPEFAQRLEELETGELSEPFRTRFGWHIVEVTDRRTYDTTDEVKEQRCAETVRASKMEEQQQLWVQQIRDQAFVDTRL